MNSNLNPAQVVALIAFGILCVAVVIFIIAQARNQKGK